MTEFNILFIGDVFGKPGRHVVNHFLPLLKEEENISFVICNNENATHGNGCNYNHYKELTAVGVNCFTSGNHFLGVKDPFTRGTEMPNQLRPLNFNDKYPLIGTKIFKFNDIRIRVTNIIGNTYMDLGQNNPFESFEKLLENCEPSDIHFVDFHGEATGEKRAFAEYFDGKITCMVGTHTHVQTADEKILPKGTAFISDVGSCGPEDSVLGADKNAMISKAAFGIRCKQVNPEHGLANFAGIVLSVNPNDFKVKGIKRIFKQKIC